MEEEPFEKKDLYSARTKNKRYLSKKKSYKEKGAIGSKDSFGEGSFIEDSNLQHWRVAEIRQGISRRTIECILPEMDTVKIVEVPFNSPFFDQIVIGDYVILEKDNLEGIVTRKNLLARYKGDQNRFSLHSRILQPIAANLEAIVIVASAKDPTFQPGFIDRYMVLAEQSGISPIICITKSDLKPIDDPILHWYEHELGISVIHTSAISKEGIGKVADAIRGKTVAFVGKSGVGKSSLTNILLGQEIIRTSQVSEKWGQGRHTTTGSKLYIWEKGSHIVDTPGIRSLEFLEISPPELKMYFSEFMPFAELCRYRDCMHYQEADCQVKTAVENGEIADFRYRTYIRLLEEVI